MWIWNTTKCKHAKWNANWGIIKWILNTKYCLIDIYSNCESKYIENMTWKSSLCYKWNRENPTTNIPQANLNQATNMLQAIVNQETIILKLMWTKLMRKLHNLIKLSPMSSASRASLWGLLRKTNCYKSIKHGTYFIVLKFVAHFLCNIVKES